MKLVVIVATLWSIIWVAVAQIELEQSFVDDLIRNITDPPGGGKGVYSESNQPTRPGWESKYKLHIPRVARIGEDEFQIFAPHSADDQHFLEYVFALDQDGVLVFAKNISASRTSEVLERFTVNSPTAEYIKAYLTCNIHSVWTSDFHERTQLGVELEVSKIESQDDPLTPEIRLAKTKSHVTTLTQVDAETLKLEMPTHAVQAIDYSDDHNGHFIEAVWVRRVGAGNEVIFFRNVTLVEGQVSVLFRPMEHLLNESLTSPVRLQASAWCNIHGLWKSDVITLVPPLYWNIASEFGAPTREDECSLQDGIHLRLGEGGASVRIGLDADLARQDKLLTHFTLPVGTFAGLGLNSKFSMINTKALVARGLQSTNSDVTLYSLLGQKRSQVVPSGALVEIRNLSMVNDTVEIVVEYPILASQMDHIILYAFGELDSSNRLQQHDEQGSFEIPKDGTWITLTPRVVFDAIESFHNGTGECSPLLVTAKCESDSTHKRDVKVTHGVLMFIIWSFNITVGVFVARYERHTTWWLHVHKFLQLLCSITTIPVYVIGFIAAEASSHFASTHGKLGLFIAFISSVQVVSGVVMYMSAKLSRRLLHFLVAHPALPSDIGEALVLDFEKNPQGTILLQRKFESEQDPNWLTIQRLKKYKTVDLSSIITTFVDHHTLSQRIIYEYVVPFKKNVIIPLHHWLGRILLIMVYVQMYLGVRLLNLDPFVVYCFYGWIGVLVLLLLYKEIVYQRKIHLKNQCNGGASQNGKKKNKCNSCSGEASRSQRATTSEDEAMSYTRTFMRNKRRHEQEILSIHNFVGTPSCKRKVLASEKKLSTDENRNQIIVEKDSEPQLFVSMDSLGQGDDDNSKDGDSKSTGASEEITKDSPGAQHLSNV